MSQLTLFGEQEARPAPIARSSDPVTSHNAADKVQCVVTNRQRQCLEVLKEFGNPMTSNELAAACCEKFCSDLRYDPQQYAKRLDNFRKRADEIKRNDELCIRLNEERNGCQLFRAKESA
nr:MAG TPA: HTH domain protein [Caudoviricetes sp.]